MDENEEKTIVDKGVDAGKKFVKRKTKSAIWKLLKPILPIILKVLGVFFAGLLLIGLTMAIQKLVQDTIKSIFNLGSETSEVGTSEVGSAEESTTVDIDDIIEIDENNGGYKLKIKDLGKQLRQKLEDQKVNNELMGFEIESEKQDSETGETIKELEDMMDAYVKAEVQTTYPETGVDTSWFKESLDGIITIKRASIDTGDTGKIEPLEYIKYDKFNKKIENQDSDVMTYFSLNPDDFKLCIARKGNSGERTYVKEEIEYKKYVQNYSVPLNFFISLHVVAQDVDFMKDVVDMVLGKDKKDPIELTYVEKLETTTTTYSYTGTVKEKKETEGPTETTPDYDKKPFRPTARRVQTQIQENYVDDGAEDTIEPAIKITPIDNGNVKDYYSGAKSSTEQTYRTGELVLTNADTWLKTSGKEISETPSTKTISSSTSGPTTVKSEDGVIIQESSTTTKTETAFTITEKESEINVDDFVQLIRDYPDVENNITSAPSDLFYLLQQSEKTQRLERIMRYVLYELTDINYGVLEEDLEDLLSDILPNDKANSMKQFNQWGDLDAYLDQFGGDRSTAKYVKMYADQVGWPTIGRGDMQWKSHWQKFSVEGYIKHKGVEKKVPNVAQYIRDNCLTRGHDAKYTVEEVAAMDIYVERALVDSKGSSLRQSMYNHVISTLDNAGISLTKQQIYPLVGISLNFGNINILERNGKTFTETYNEASNLYDEGSWQHNQYIWDNWWGYLGGGGATHVFGRDFQFETYVKGVFYFTDSETGGFSANAGKKYYLFYSKEQIDYHQRLINANTKLPAYEKINLSVIPCKREQPGANIEEIFTTVQACGEYTKSTDTYVAGYYQATTGRTFTILNQCLIDSYSPGWGGYCNRAASAIIASGYSDKTPKELIDDIDDKYVSGSIIPTTDQYFGSYGLDRVFFQSGHKDVKTYTQILSEHLQNGGYAAVWVTRDKRKGINSIEGKSKVWATVRENDPEHVPMHWVAVIDYRIQDGNEQIVIADWSGAYWYDIDEFCNGIDNLALISEK